MSVDRAYRILVVEDDEIILGIIREFLLIHSYEIRTVSTGEDAIVALESEAPDLVLLDMHLPDMNGLQLLDRLRTKPQFLNLPIVLMSADLAEDLTVSALERGATEFVHKPLRHDELELRLRRILESKSRLTEGETGGNLRFYRVTLSQSFSDDTLARMKDEAASALKGEKLTASVLYLCLHDLTRNIASLNANPIADVLNEVFTDVMDVVFKHQGSVNKFLGDAMLATFGYPFMTSSDARNAIDCALEIIETIDRFNSIRPGALRQNLEAGVGIATGQVFAGMIGSFRRKEYVVIGGVVGSASRLERLTHKSKYNVMVDSNTAIEAGSDVQTTKLTIKNARGDSKQAFALSRKNLAIAEPERF
ncbi:MAG: adenylate/guanylate cyclase domain-containing response regulator [Spirochaetia bacterium]|nr:adenylate/guanylate cyclase domain-containing response regulator [Spirochaetia bacterium]